MLNCGRTPGRIEPNPSLEYPELNCSMPREELLQETSLRLANSEEGSTKFGHCHPDPELNAKLQHVRQVESLGGL